MTAGPSPKRRDLPGSSEAAATQKGHRPLSSRTRTRQIAEQCGASVGGFVGGGSAASVTFGIVGRSGELETIAVVVAGIALALVALLVARSLQLERDAALPLRSTQSWDHAMADIVRRYPHILVHARSAVLFSPETRARAPKYAAALESRLADPSPSVSVLYMVQDGFFSRSLSHVDLSRRGERARLLRSQLTAYVQNPRIELYSVRSGDTPSAVIGLDEDWNSGTICIGDKGERGEVFHWGVRVSVPEVVVLLARTYRNLSTTEGSRRITTEFWQTDIQPQLDSV
jgi:hypothetical protein